MSVLGHSLAPEIYFSVPEYTQHRYTSGGTTPPITTINCGAPPTAVFS